MTTTNLLNKGKKRWQNRIIYWF